MQTGKRVSLVKSKRHLIQINIHLVSGGKVFNKENRIIYIETHSFNVSIMSCVFQYLVEKVFHCYSFFHS